MQTYIYYNSDGSINRRVTKSDAKKFRQYAPNGKPGVVGIRPVIYNLPAVLEAIRVEKPIWITEGEKDADSLIALGLVATTNPQGAGQWKRPHSEFLSEAVAVNIVYDNDEKGMSHAILVAHSLEAIAEIDTHDIHFFRAFVGKDVTDHLEAGYTLADLVAGPPTIPESAADETRRHEPASAPQPHAPAAFQLAIQRLTEYAKRKRLPPPRSTGENSYEVCCPAHDDRSPSLGVMVGVNQPVVVNCQAGCSLADIALALDINPREFSQNKTVLESSDDLVQKTLERMRATQTARDILLSESSGAKSPLQIIPWQQYLVSEGEEIEFTIDELHPKGSNSLLVAAAKSGKTTLLINLQRSLSQGTAFAEHWGTRAIQGKVAYLEFEMIAHVFRTWLVTNGVPKLSKIVVPQHLRGYASPFISPQSRDHLIDWLGTNDVECLIIDPIARAWQGIVDNENDNSQVARFTHILDEVKNEAGVVDLIVATHTGRTAYAQDEEHARGATRLEDWADSLWYYMRDEKGGRSLRAIGRQVELEATFIDYDPVTFKVYTTGATRRAREDDYDVQGCVDTLAELIETEGDEVTTRMFRTAMPRGNTNANRTILKAIERGYIDRRTGGRKTQYHSLTEAGMQLHKRQITYNANDEDE